MHYFQGRHKQALQDYEKAIVYSKMQLELFVEEGMDKWKNEIAANAQKISDITRNKDVSKPISCKNPNNNDSLIQSEIMMMSNRKEYFNSAANDKSNDMSLLLNSYLNFNNKEDKEKDVYSSNNKIKEEEGEQG